MVLDEHWGEWKGRWALYEKVWKGRWALYAPPRRQISSCWRKKVPWKLPIPILSRCHPLYWVQSTHISIGLEKKETAVEICPKLPDFLLHNTNLPCPCLSSFTERNLTTLKLGTNKWKESPIEMILKPQRESRPSHPPVGRDRVPQHHEYISRLGLIFQNRLAVTLLTVIAFIDAGGLRP